MKLRSRSASLQQLNFRRTGKHLRSFIAVLGFLTAGFQASQAATAVSNLDQPEDLPRLVGYQDGYGPSNIGMSFTTGSTSQSLQGITLSMDNSTGSPTGLTLQLYANFTQAGGPSGLISSFVPTQNPTAAGDYFFPGSATLSANTAYYLIASAPTTASTTFYAWSHTPSSAEDAGGLPGWSIGNDYFVYNSFSAPNWNSFPGAMKFAPDVVPEPSSLLFAATGLTILMLQRRRNGA